MQGTARRAVSCSHAQAGPGLGRCGSGLRRRRRHLQWAAVGAAALLGQGNGRLRAGDLGSDTGGARQERLRGGGGKWGGGVNRIGMKMNGSPLSPFIKQLDN